MMEGRNGGDLLRRESWKYYLGWKGVSEPPSVELGLSSGKGRRWFNNSNTHRDQSSEAPCRWSVALVRGDLV